jgi:hypothetical protein
VTEQAACSAVPRLVAGLPPVEVALVVVVRFRDRKLAHEHICWDQASVLAQVGLIDPARLPVAVADPARLTSLPESREKNRLTPEIAGLITNNARQINCLRSRHRAPSGTVLREAGRPLRERAGRESLDMTASPSFHHRIITYYYGNCHIDDTSTM